MWCWDRHSANHIFLFPATLLLGSSILGTNGAWKDESVKRELIPYTLFFTGQQFLTVAFTVDSYLLLLFGSLKTSLFMTAQQYPHWLSNALSWGPSPSTGRPLLQTSSFSNNSSLFHLFPQPQGSSCFLKSLCLHYWCTPVFSIL